MRRASLVGGCALVLCMYSSVGAATRTMAWDHDGVNTTHYTLYRSTNNGTSFVSYGQTPLGTKVFTDANIPLNTSMCYKVTATGQGGESSASSAVCFLVPEPPQVPINLRFIP